MISLPNIPKEDVLQSPILKTIFTRLYRPVVFLPNYGDFGPIIHKVIKIVHFTRAPQKIVCCHKGEEAFYPSADDFYYDWANPVDEKYRWALFTKKKITSIGTNEHYDRYTKIYNDEFLKIRKHLGTHCHYIHLWKFNVDRVFEKYDHLFRFLLRSRTNYDISADIIISPRYRQSRIDSNFQQWPEIIDLLSQHGYSVGCVGSKEESLHLPNSSINSWDYDDNSSACIELLSKCKLYLGLDTGVSHLAAFMSVPMILFSHANPQLYSTNFMKRMTQGYFLDLGKSVSDNSIIIDAVLHYLKDNRHA